jgi:uncharacterized protein involved in exopolysaccharide biosynthesis
MKHYPIAIPTPFDTFRAKVYQVFKWPYLTFTCASYVLIGFIVFLYMNKQPTFKSELALVLPGTGASSSVSIDDVGQVVSQTSAPFSSRGFNPRVNYKEMLISRRVIEHASDEMAMTLQRFGQPKITLTEQTSILEVSISGTSPLQAQKKAWSLYKGLQEELDRLRADEVNRRDVSIQKVLEEYRIRLNEARNNILEFQENSFLVSQEQFAILVSNLESLKNKRRYLSAESANLRDYNDGLGKNLGISPDLAGKAFILQSDVEFRGLLNELDISTAQLTQYLSRWGEGHPKVIAEQQRFNSAKAALLDRSNLVAGPHAAAAFGNLTLDPNPKRAQMFADLIDSSAKLEGKEAEIIALQRTEAKLNDQIKIFARESAVLDRLQREFDLAEAIFTSAAARLEAGKADVFASYPVVQLLTEPSLAIQAQSPIPQIGIAAGLIGIIFITSGVTVLCNRRRIIKALLKRS